MFGATNEARFWDRIARKYATDPIADTAGYEHTLDRTSQLLDSDDTVFEFGCGTGTTALRLAPSVARIVATDISGEMIAIAREKAKVEGCANIDFQVATPDNIPHGASHAAHGHADGTGVAVSRMRCVALRNGVAIAADGRPPNQGSVALDQQMIVTLVGLVGFMVASGPMHDNALHGCPR